MATKTKFRVEREHFADRTYLAGEERTALLSDVQHLVPHVLTPIGRQRVAGQATKAVPEAPENKAITGRKTKGS